jgi:tol-pal system protein YbgF
MVKAPGSRVSHVGRLGRGALTAIAVLALAHPTAAQSRREMQMMADIRMLQEQSQQLQVAIAQLNEVLKTITTRIDDQGNVNRKAFADQKLVTDQLASDIRVVRERVDETNVRIGALSQEIEGLRVSIPQYGTTPPPTDAANPEMPGATTPGSSTPSSQQPTTPPGPGMSPQRLYDMAWTDYTAGQWALCIAGFDNYLRTFPRSELADEAQYYIGECNYSDGKFNEAVDAYNKVINNYPKGESVPNAYYKRGLAFERLGQQDRAKESFDAVIKTFPNSDAAGLAKQALARVTNKPGVD